jgi:4-amino-4-deoxy-L-arabinose transferase-like glycosyltransferase
MDPSEPPVFCAASAFRQAISACTVHPKWSSRVGHCIVIKGQMRLPRFRPAAIQIAIFALAAVLNFYQIGRASLWNDEGFSFFAAQSGPAHALQFIASDTQPPLYYLTLSLWLGLGTSVFVIRALSAAAMTLALLPLHAAARRLFDERVALLASFLFAIAPLNITWAQKARPYPLQLLLVACAFYGFVRVWRARDQVIGAGVRDAFRQRAVRLASVDLGWFAYVVGGALAMLAQAPAGFFLLGCNVAMALTIFRNVRRNRILLLNWIIAQLALILVWMLWLPVFLHQIAAHLTAGQIASKHAIFLVGFDQVLGNLQVLFGIAALWRPSRVFLAIYVVLACFAIVRIARRQPQAWPLLVVIFVPIAACVAGFALVHPIFGYVIYTFLWMLVPYTILIAFAIVSIRPALLRCGVLAIVLIGNAWGIKNVYQTDTPPLDRVAAVIRTNMTPGDGIVLSEATSGRWGIAYYLGPPYSAMVGLDTQDWGDAHLIHSLADMNGLRRVWVVLLDGEAPAVDMAAVQHTMKPAFSERVGAFQITRFE